MYSINLIKLPKNMNIKKYFASCMAFVVCKLNNKYGITVLSMISLD